MKSINTNTVNGEGMLQKLENRGKTNEIEKHRRENLRKEKRSQIFPIKTEVVTIRLS